MNTDLMKTIARVRRTMPRNADVMEICDALERKLSERPDGVITLHKPDEVVVIDADGTKKFDKRAYQRELMRKRRAEGKA